ncbi:MAG TPA: alpha/beta hydrolase [Candidatus Limnocylindria bacterium]|nr:alpha/beta hydrolase [Candidatus Limnocylindria bacterium]
MTAVALGIAVLGAAVALAIHVTMPTFALMVVRLVAAELSAYLIVVELVAVVLALVTLRDAPRTVTVAVALAGIVLAGVPLAQVPSTIAAASGALDAIGAPQIADAAFSPGRLFTRLPAPDVRRSNDIPFRSVGGMMLKLDRYDGAGAGPHPALVVVHGGSWRNGDKGEGSTDPTITNRIFSGRGITVYDIEYRLVPAATFPAQLEDVLCALGHVRAHAKDDGVDPERVALLGRSSGAHLALLAAYRAGRDPVPTGCDRPATVRGVISLYGPTDLARGYRAPAEPDLIGGSGAIADLLGGTPDALPARYAQATPQNALDRSVPPTLLIHGDADQIVKPYHSTSLAAALAESGGTVALIELPWAGHGFDAISWGIGGQLALSAMLRFLGLVLATR